MGLGEIILGEMGLGEMGLGEMGQNPLETSDGHCLTSVRLTRSCQFFSQTIHTCHRPSLVRKLFLLGVCPPFFLFIDPLSNSDRPSLFCPFKPSKTIKTI